MNEKSTLKKRLQSYHNPKLIPKYHESCKNHELRQIMDYNKDEKECPYEIHIKCLKGHKLTETSVNECKDYELTDENFAWKFELMEKICKDVFKNIPYEHYDDSWDFKKELETERRRSFNCSDRVRK